MLRSDYRILTVRQFVGGYKHAETSGLFIALDAQQWQTELPSPNIQTAITQDLPKTKGVYF